MERYILDVLKDALGERKRDKILAVITSIALLGILIYFYHHFTEIKKFLLLKGDINMDDSGAILFVLIFVVLPVAILIIWFISSLFRGKSHVETDTAYGSAHRVTLQELEDAHLLARTPATHLMMLGTIPLGFPLWYPSPQELQRQHPRSGVYRVAPTISKDRMLVLTEAQQERHIIIVAPSGRGKTSTVIIPALLYEGGHRSLIISDPKGELFKLTGGSLAEEHRVYQFAPTKPRQSIHYNPLAHIQTMEDAEEFAACLIVNTGVSSEPFWNNASKLLLTACSLHLVKAQEMPPLSALVDLICDTPIEELKDTLQNSPSPIARSIAGTFFNSLAKNERLSGSIMVELATRLFPLRNPDIISVTAKNALDFEEFTDLTALFIHIPAADTHRLKWLSACLIMQAMRRFHQLADEQGKLSRGVTFMLDEFGNQHIPQFETYISIVRSMGIAFIMAVQGHGQIEQTYGSKQSLDTILGNASTHIVFSGMGPTECTYYSERSGDTTTPLTSRSTSYSNSGTTESYSYGFAHRKLFTPDEIRTLPEEGLMVFCENLPPIDVYRVPYYENKYCIEEAKIPFTLPEWNTVESVLPASLVPIDNTQEENLLELPELADEQPDTKPTDHDLFLP